MGKLESGERRDTVDDAIERALRKLDLPAKVRLLTGANFWATHPLPEIGLRAMVVSDGPQGVKGGSFSHDETTTSLPSPTSIAASWDEDLVHGLGELLAGEARAKGVDVLLGPTINLHRSPVGGRHFEQFSEDPLLTGRVAAAYIRGLQSRGVGGCPKHYVCNDSENERQSYRVDVDERPLRELYMAPFERTVREAEAWTVMAAYSGVGDHRMTESPLLADPLKATEGEMAEAGGWGFDGVVVSDWYAVHSTVESARAGLDLIMPGPESDWGPRLVEAVRRGDVDEDAVDEKVRRLLRLAARVGALEGVPPATPLATKLPPDRTAALVRRASAAGTVLLRNDGLLPLDLEGGAGRGAGRPGSAAIRRIALLGPNAATEPEQGGGSANLRPDYAVTPLEGLRAALPGDVEILWNPAERIRPGMQQIARSEVRLPAAAGPRAGEPGILVRVCEPGPGPLAGELGPEVARDVRPDGRLTWAGDARFTGKKVLEFSAAISSEVGGRHRIGFALRGETAIWVDGRLVQQGGEIPRTDDIDALWHNPPFVAAEVDMVAGKAVDFVFRWHKPYDLPSAFINFSMEKPALTFEEVAAEDERLARQADAVVLTLGTTHLDEAEGGDRTSLELPRRQDELARRVIAANPRTIVVVSTGAPVLMPWRDETAALLLTWFPGQEGGNALADVLLGRVEPGGRLPTTWPVRTEDVPVLDTHPVNGILHYTEGLHVGYRAWLRSGRQPAFPFGHGLGYTSWKYLSAESTGTPSAPAVRVRLRNTGPRHGREVVQLYLSRPDSAVERPALWLAGYAPATADPGHEVEVTIPIDSWALRHWDTGVHAWAAEPGAFHVSVGRSLADLRLEAVVNVRAGTV